MKSVAQKLTITRIIGIIFSAFFVWLFWFQYTLKNKDFPVFLWIFFILGCLILMVFYKKYFLILAYLFHLHRI